MKKLLIILLLFASCKQDYQSYRIHNSTKSKMYVNLTDGNYSFGPGQGQRIISTGEIKKENISFEDTQLKPIMINLLTHPDISYNITAYVNYFEVYVFGNADSVEIWINGRYYNEKVPFSYGDDSTKEYYIKSDPTNEGYTYTYVMIEGALYQRIEHYHGNPGVLTNTN